MSNDRQRDLEALSARAIDVLSQNSLTQSWLEQSGDIFQCKTTAYKPGKFYVMGFNPGGNSEEGRPLHDTLQELSSINGEEQHPLVDRHLWGSLTRLAGILQRADALALSAWQENLFVTNLFPNASGGVRDWRKLNPSPEQEYVSAVWPIHKMMLGIVKPSHVIAFGQGSRDSTFRYLWNHLRERAGQKAWNDTMHPKTKALDPSIKSFTVRGLPVLGGVLKEVTFIGIRHLSRFPAPESLRHLI